jgi:hypothetical protein
MSDLTLKGKDLPKCERCNEPIPPVDIKKDWPRRVRGEISTRTHTVTWVFYRFPWGTWGQRERVETTNTKAILCDGCWGDLLDWITEPGQERAKIAAEHRRTEQRVREVAEARREADVQRHMREQEDAS